MLRVRRAAIGCASFRGFQLRWLFAATPDYADAIYSFRHASFDIGHAIAIRQLPLMMPLSSTPPHQASQLLPPMIFFFGFQMMITPFAGQHFLR
jgi:hypothetical protein